VIGNINGKKLIWFFPYETITKRRKKPTKIKDIFNIPFLVFIMKISQSLTIRNYTAHTNYKKISQTYESSNTSHKKNNMKPPFKVQNFKIKQINTSLKSDKLSSVHPRTGWLRFSILLSTLSIIGKKDEVEWARWSQPGSLFPCLKYLCFMCLWLHSSWVM